MTDERSSPSWREHLAIALVSMAVLLFEILVTRLLSVTLSYHFAFLAVSLAMLGLAAPGVWLSVREPGRNALLYSLVASTLAIPISILSMLHLGAPLRDQPAAWVVFLLCPLLALGTAICLLLLRAKGAGVSRMYAADLFGAAAGAVLAVPLLSGLSTPAVLAGLGLLPACALLLVDDTQRKLALSLTALLTGSLFVGPVYRLNYTRFDIEVVPPLYERWTPTARISIYRDVPFGGWGLGANYRGAPSDHLWLNQDGSAGTPILHFTPGSPRPEHLMYDVTSVPYQLDLGKRACIIGGGGGKDILSALEGGSTDVEVVELNPWTVDAVSNVFTDVSGDPYHLPGVVAHVGEGRSHFSRQGKPCDVLQISQIDTFAASSAGAYALTENSLYTVEALQAFMERLSEDGVLSISRWAQGPAWPESVRLVLLVMNVLKEAGLPFPEQHIAVVAAEGTANILIFKKPLQRERLRKLAEVARFRGFDELWPNFGPPLQPVTLALKYGASRFEDAGFDMSAPTDDRPFFFQTLKFFGGSDSLAAQGTGEREQSVSLLRQLAVILFVITIGLLFTPLVASRYLPRGPGWVRATCYFSCLGLGFMFVEIPLLQRLALYLGHPSYATIVVLGALLLGAGGGATLVERIPPNKHRMVAQLVPLSILGVATLLVLWIIPTTQGASLTFRVVITASLVSGLGLPMGLMFPLGMQYFDGRDRSWFWAVNAALSVLSGVLALVLALLAGFTTVLTLAIVVYALAALVLPRSPAQPE